MLSGNIINFLVYTYFFADELVVQYGHNTKSTEACFFFFDMYVDYFF